MRPVDDPDNLDSLETLMIVLCPGIGFLLGVVFLMQGKPKGFKMIGYIILVWGGLLAVGAAMSSMSP